MKTKYRIIKLEGVYYPQYLIKILGIFPCWFKMIDYNGEFSSERFFYSIEDAIDCINKQKQKDNIVKPKKEVVWTEDSDFNKKFKEVLEVDKSKMYYK